MSARCTAAVLTSVLLAGMGVSASAAGPAPVGCALSTDTVADQTLINSGVPNNGMGPASLDIRSLRIAMTRTEIALTWSLTDLIRPTAPGESFNYRYEFSSGELHYALLAKLQAQASPTIPAGTPLSDMFLFGRQSDPVKDPMGAALGSSTEVSGRFDLQRKTVTILLPARLLARADLSSFSMQHVDAYTDRQLGSTMGIFADRLDSLPPGRYTINTHRGC